MKKRAILLIALLCGYTGKSIAYPIMNDVSRLDPTEVDKVFNVQKEKDIKDAISYAKKHHKTISISGKHHSQGGQTLFQHSVHLNMLNYNKVLNLDVKNKTISVESGATWAIIQRKINPYNLAIKVMQSSNIFTVGGSMSVNAHGRDPNYGPLIETVQSFHLLLPNGKVIFVSRVSHPELFKLIIGGYGLFGIILDVQLSLTDNYLLRYHAKMLNDKDFLAYFNKYIKNKKDIALFFARLSVSPNENFLKQMYIVTYNNTGTLAKKSSVMADPDKKEGRFIKPFFDFSRRSDFGKSLLWNIERLFYVKLPHSKIYSRNNAMRPPIKFLTDYKNPHYTDILQEYFIPIENFVAFTNGLRQISRKNRINLLNVTIRYEPANDLAFLPYATRDSFAFVIYVNIPLSSKGVADAKKWTRDSINLALKEKGTYYLPYQLWGTQYQLKKAYPNIESFCQLKNQYDPSHLLMNKFYSLYCMERTH